MQNTSQIERQAMGCGYEPPAPDTIEVRIWDNPARDPDCQRPLTTCPGFTCALNEVRETSFARMHWNKNQLAAWSRGEVTEQQLGAIEVLELSSQQCEAWSAENPPKKGT